MAKILNTEHPDAYVARSQLIALIRDGQTEVIVNGAPHMIGRSDVANTATIDMDPEDIVDLARGIDSTGHIRIRFQEIFGRRADIPDARLERLQVGQIWESASGVKYRVEDEESYHLSVVVRNLVTGRRTQRSQDVGAWTLVHDPLYP